MFSKAKPILAVLALCTAGAVHAQVVKFTLGTSNSDKTPSTIVMKEWADSMRKASSGKLDMKVLSGGSLGSDQVLLEQLSTNEIQINIAGPTVVHSLAKEYQCLEAEYAIRDAEHGMRVWTGPLGKEVSDVLTKRYKIRIVGIAHRGAREVTSNKPVKTPEELKNVKIRVPTKLRGDVFAAMGANPASMSFTELYGGLQTGVIDAQENPVNAIIGQSFFEVQKYLIKTSHVWSYFVVTANDEFYQSLPAEHRKIFDEELAKAMNSLNTKVMNSIKSDEDFLKSKGLTIIEVDQARFKKLADPVVEKYAETNCRPGLLKDIAKY